MKGKILFRCIERKYNPELFQNNVKEFPFDDHSPPPFNMIYEFCKDVDSWLKCHEENIAAIHCKAGKGRTGLMICCYLLYCKMFTKAGNALKYYGMIRTKNKKVSLLKLYFP